MAGGFLLLSSLSSSTVLVRAGIKERICNTLASSIRSWDKSLISVIALPSILAMAFG